MISWYKKLLSKRLPACSESGCKNALDESCLHKRCSHHCEEKCLRIGLSFDAIEKLLFQLSNAEVVVRCQKCFKRNRLAGAVPGRDPVCGNCGSLLLPKRPDEHFTKLN
jgi:hypothetical protein